MSHPPLNKDNFREYLDALENVDVELLSTRFYHKNFRVTAGEISLDLDGLLEFETSLKQIANFRFHEKRVVADKDGIAMEANETFDILNDGEIPNIGPVKPGERWNIHFIAFYDLLDGRIASIAVHNQSVMKMK